MTRFRLVLLSMLVVFAASAATSTSASANDACPHLGSEWTVCFETPGGLLQECYSPQDECGPLVNVGGEAVKSKLKAKALGFEVVIECSKAKVEVKGKEAESENPGKIRFSECAVTKPAKGCRVKEPIEFNFQSEIVEEGSTKIGPEFWGEKGGPTKEEEKFVSITLEKNGAEHCAIAESPTEFEVKGSQWCEAPSAETKAEHKTVECKTTGSELKFGGEAATFEATFTSLEPEKESIEKWAWLRS